MGKRLAVCIGVNKHKYIPSANLNFACHDVQAIAALLREPTQGDFDSVIELLNDHADKETILETLRTILIAQNLGQDDLAFIYFSGHGATDRGENFYAVPHDVEFFPSNSQNGKTIDVTKTIHINELELLLDNTQAGHVICIFDACHSGASGKLLGNIKYDENSNVMLIGSARFSEEAWETPEFQHGRFTECFLRAINQAPTQGEWITLQQALSFVQQEMQKIHATQTMEVTSHLVEQNIRLFKNPMYSLISDEFMATVKDLCEISNCQIVPMQPNQISPNVFIMKEARSFGRHDHTVVMGLDNRTVNVSGTHIEQFNILFRSLQMDNQVTNGMIITRNQLPANITKDIHRAIETRTIDDLLRNLINFDRYLKQLVDDFEKGDSERRGDPPLGKYYVELNAQERIVFTGEKLSQVPELQPITEIITEWLKEDDERAAIVLGSYGTGKTTFSRKIAYELAKAYRLSPNKHNLRIPILFPLRRFPKVAAVDIVSTIIAHLKQNCNVINPDFAAFQAMNKAGLFLLVFDGFDEMAVQAHKEIIGRNFLEIIQFAINPNTKILITSRPEAFLSHREEIETLSPDDTILLENYPTLKQFEISPLSTEQIEQYLQKRIPLIKKAVSLGKDWRYYRDKINDIIGLENLAKRPVLLEMTIKALPILIAEGGVVSRPRLYETYLTGEIRRQQMLKKRDFLIREASERLDLIQLIACYLYEEKQVEMTVEQIQKILQQELSSEQKGNLGVYVRDLIACSFLIREEDLYRFSHLSIMEYLVAKNLAQEIESDEPLIFKHNKLTPAVRDFLIELQPENDDSWRTILWKWIGRTKNESKEVVLYTGGNAITLLNDLGESFIGQDLANTILSEADLQGSQCQEAFFNDSNLEGLNFSNANLIDTSFRKANLENVDFTNAVFNETLKKTAIPAYVKSSPFFEEANLKGTLYLALTEEIFQYICVCRFFYNSALPYVLERVGSRIRSTEIIWLVGDLQTKGFLRPYGSIGELVNYEAAQAVISTWENYNIFTQYLHEVWRDWYRTEFQKNLSPEYLADLLYHEAAFVKYVRNESENMLDFLKAKTQEYLSCYRDKLHSVDYELNNPIQTLRQYISSEELDRFWSWILPPLELKAFVDFIDSLVSLKEM